MINLEVFSCSGGMAEGFRRAGVEFDMAVDFSPDHVASYEKNIGHRPVCMDARDLVRMVRLGWRVEVNLLVADPPCTPWSRAGKRLGTADDRDMLEETCDLIALLKPRAFVIGNVPGLDDSDNWPVVQRVIGGLSAHGYCTADFVKLNAANYGVPQHRVRPFWFGHLGGRCIRWPSPTHCDPLELASESLPGVERLRPWVTCRDALAHLSADEVGRRVRLRRRDDKHPVVDLDAPSTTIRGGGAGHSAPEVVVRVENNSDFDADRPASTITAAARGTQVMTYDVHHPPHDEDRPANTIRAGDGGGARTAMRKRDRGRVGQGSRVGSADRPASTVTAKASRVGAGESHVLEWPWGRPATTVQCDERIGPPGHHDDEFNGGLMSDDNAVVVSEKAAAILQGFPEGWVFCGATKRARWSQLGQAMPPPLAEAVARSVAAQMADAERDAKRTA